jgi:hypothetical protein
MRKTFASATCSQCNADFDRIPVDYNEDGTGYVAIPTTPCADPKCSVLLCPCCDQFHCDGCGDTFCAEHMVSVPDGTERPLHCCRPCADEVAQQELPLEELPARMEPGSAHPADAAFPAMA